jgi:hypothetical protein
MSNKLTHACQGLHNLTQVHKIEERYNGSLVGEFALYEYANISCLLFYSENPPKEFSHYFIIYKCPMDGVSKIARGDDVAEKVRVGIVTPKGDFIYSRHRHDYVVHDGCTIDGGDAYYRYSGDGDLVNFTIEKDRMRIVTNA